MTAGMTAMHSMRRDCCPAPALRRAGVPTPRRLVCAAHADFARMLAPNTRAKVRRPMAHQKPHARSIKSGMARTNQRCVSTPFDMINSGRFSVGICCWLC